VSPWTRGHAVVSEVFDHTSVIKFVETRFNVTLPTLSPWRRAMTGNLLSAFNFTSPDYTWPSGLPDTSGYVNQSNWQCDNLPPVTIPAAQAFPPYEPGTRISRALPYQFLVSDAVSVGATAATLALNITNTGAAGAPFNLLDVANLAAVTPRKYAVTPGASVVDPLPINLTSSSTTAAAAAAAVPAGAAGAATAPGQYFYALHGPNGFVRTFLGDVSIYGGLGTTLSAAVTYDVAGDAVVVTMANGAAAGNGNTVEFTVTDNAYDVPGGPTWTFTLPGGGVAGSTASLSVPTGAVGGWYDVTISAALPGAGQQPLMTRRAMGRMETGRDTISDPAMAAGKPGYVPVPHAFASEAAWHAAMDAAFPVGATGSRATRAALAWDATTGAIAHPPTPEHLRLVPRAGAAAAATHKDAKWRWDADAVRGGEL
jgi:phospholipase C